MDAKRLANFSIKKAHNAQLRMSEQIIFEDKLPVKIRYVAGVDVAYTKEFSIGAVAVLEYETLSLVEKQTSVCRTHFPYVPTLLSFREIPPTIQCIRKLHAKSDVFLVDGQGFAHPYRCGFASHLGVAIGKPTIGVAKSRLFGEMENSNSNEVTYLKHKGEVIGAVVKTKQDCKPVYVSVGHMISLKTAIKIVRQCSPNNRIPEPIVKAHEIATAEKQKLNIS